MCKMVFEWYDDRENNEVKFVHVDYDAFEHDNIIYFDFISKYKYWETICTITLKDCTKQDIENMIQFLEKTFNVDVGYFS